MGKWKLGTADREKEWRSGLHTRPAHPFSYLFFLLRRLFPFVPLPFSALCELRRDGGGNGEEQAKKKASAEIFTPPTHHHHHPTRPLSRSKRRYTEIRKSPAMSFKFQWMRGGEGVGGWAGGGGLWARAYTPFSIG